MKLKIHICFKGVWGQKCYVCKNQDENTGKCATTVQECSFGEDYCLSEIRWGSTPFWEIGAPMQYYISKKCATADECVTTKSEYMPYCQRIWWRDWKCAECCKGDRCNYFITLGSSTVTSNIALMLLAGTFTLLLPMFHWSWKVKEICLENAKIWYIMDQDNALCIEMIFHGRRWVSTVLCILQCICHF